MVEMLRHTVTHPRTHVQLQHTGLSGSLSWGCVSSHKPIREITQAQQNAIKHKHKHKTLKIKNIIHLLDVMTIVFPVQMVSREFQALEKVSVSCILNSIDKKRIKYLTKLCFSLLPVIILLHLELKIYITHSFLYWKETYRILLALYYCCSPCFFSLPLCLR